eukprot:3697200-Pyramimonas_sp.AAC.1
MLARRHHTARTHAAPSRPEPPRCRPTRELARVVMAGATCTSVLPKYAPWARLRGTFRLAAPTAK